MGDAHGRAHGEEIRHYARDRVSLVAGGLWSGGPLPRSRVLELAKACLPAHEEFSPRLHAEMLSMAAAAGITAAEALVVGGFTDFVDTVRAVTGGACSESLIEDDCTAVVVPDGVADGAGMLAQTWDMHDTATNHVVLARLRPAEGPEALVFTTVGCLGQIGMNSAGLCVGINNLTGTDGRFGVTWPTVVREMLAQASAPDALSVLLRADLAGAHNYLIFDAEGRGYSVEAMPSHRPVQVLAGEPLVHTNHVTDDAAAPFEGERDAEVMTNSRLRLEVATKMLAGWGSAVTPQRLMTLTREPTAICRRPDAKYRVESSGAVIMRPRTSDFWACWGLPADNDFEHFSLEWEPCAS